MAAGTAGDCARGWDEVLAVLSRERPRLVLVEAFPGVRRQDLEPLVRGLRPDRVLETVDAMLAAPVIEALVAPELTDDPVFGRLSRLRMEDFFDPKLLEALRRDAEGEDRVVVVGPGASLAGAGDVTILAEMPRWETQLRQRRGEVDNLGVGNRATGAWAQYKRSYFVDWRVCDRLKRDAWERFDHLLDTTDPEVPMLVPRAAADRAFDHAVRGPFRVVPYFDPAPWGGEWMRRVCDLDPAPPNFGWCFDCVPEENSLLLDFGGRRFETPSANLVFQRPRELLGAAVHARFGEEFPIRFDLLDTWGGGNLSLQVHPLTEYIRDNFGLDYTQDESYYMLDAGPGASVFLGLREGIERDAFAADLRRAQDGGQGFPAEAYVNRFPAARHDHFLIPAGTVHCSGAGGVVLEISATPYIFTFKLWDWDRLGLDGLPRPISLDHGLRNIRWDRDTEYARDRLVNRVTPVGAGPGWTEERTGLHEAEFIETRRHWFSQPVDHLHDDDGVNVLNLVEGPSALVESPDGAFPPFEVHYAETFIVPAAAGPYRVRPSAPGDRHATIKAFVRPGG